MATTVAPSVKSLSADEIEDVFTKFDMDGNGVLDTFELAAAMATLLGRPPTTVQVMAMVAASGAERNELTRPQWSHLVRTFDWESKELLSGLGESVYEVVFPNDSLGFRVRSVASKGIIVVSKVADAALEGVIGPNDTILAVNGAPLGFVTDHKVCVVCCCCSSSP